MARAFLWAAAEEQRLKIQLSIRRNYLRSTGQPLNLPESEFRGLFRLPKSTFQNLLTEITPLISNCGRSSAIQAETKLLTACHFYGHGSYQRAVGGNHLLSLSQTSVSDCIAEVTTALNSTPILQKYIHFPNSDVEREAVSLRFMEEFRIPGVLGCIDGTHVSIIRPARFEETYFNRKHYHSLNCLAICDCDLRIMYLDASYGGAAHDSYVWNNCPILGYMERLHERGEGYWLLGDSGYAQRPYMMTPILNPEPNSPEEYYSILQMKCRNLIERCFGVLKSRWRCLLAHRTLHYTPLKAPVVEDGLTSLYPGRDPCPTVGRIWVDDIIRFPVL